MHLLPYLSSKNILEDGCYVKTFNFCKTHYSKIKCKTFYETMQQAPINTVCICPYGLCAIKKENKKSCIIFTSLRINDFFNRQKTKKIFKDNVYNPILNLDQINILAEQSISSNNELLKISEEQHSFETMTHEVKKLNSQIKEHCECLFTMIQDEKSLESNFKFVQERIKTLYVISSMITSRYTLFDYENNSNILSFGEKIKQNIYKKFDKIRIISKNYLNQNVNVNILGSSYRCIDAYAPAFEMLPLLLIENAIKYSYKNNDNNNPVDIKFASDDEDRLIVTIESFSPFCTDEELIHIFEKGFRGKNAKKKAAGDGIGLFFVKILCDMHNIDINIKSDKTNIVQLDNISYATFTVTLTFNDTYD